MIFLFICIVSIHSLDSLDSFSPFIQQSLREWSHSLSEPTAFNSTDGDMKLFLFDDNYPNANCLDGSKAGWRIMCRTCGLQSTNQKVGQVILTGESAGGIGTMHNADYVAEQLAKLDPAPRYWASPQGGFYFPTDTLILYPEMVLNLTLDFAFFAGSYLYDFFGHPYLDESCTKAHRLFPHQCWNQAVHYKHISSNLFLAENMYDSNQIGAVLGVNWYPNKADVDEYKTYFGASMKKSLQNKIKHSDGLFMPSCYEHTANLCMLGKSPKVEGKSYAQLFTEWLYQDHDEPLHYIDTCESSLPCNTYCKC